MGVPLRVLWDDGDGGNDRAGELIAKDPRLGWRLREFFDEWFAPRYLRRCSPETSRNYLSSIRYWEAITDDWRMADVLIDADGADGQALDFTEQLPDWGYCRRGVRRNDQIRIGPLADYPSFTPLSITTASEHASRIAHLFRKAGPERDNRHHFAKLLTRPPLVEIIPSDFDEKDPFAWDLARQIASAASRMKRPVLPSWIDPPLWWQVRLGLLFYTGLRMGTVARLNWSHVSNLHSDAAAMLKVPKEIVKTRKAIEMPLHAQLRSLLRKLREQAPSNAEELVPIGCCRRNLLELHAELQTLAGVPLEHQQGLHAWRRTHLTQIYELGAGRGLEAAQGAADHSDGRTTAKSYVAMIVNHFRLRLPQLFD